MNIIIEDFLKMMAANCGFLDCNFFQTVMPQNGKVSNVFD